MVVRRSVDCFGFRPIGGYRFPALPRFPSPLHSLSFERKVRIVSRSKGFKHQKNFGNGTPMNVKRRPRKQATSPWGDKPTSERVTAVLGKKPNSWTWPQYHAIAQKTPWKLDKYRADQAPLALSSRLFLDPSRPPNDSERAAIKRAHDDLSRGTIDAEGYRAALDALALGIVPSKRRRPKVGA